LRDKFRDLYATSGSLPRASFYLVKFVVTKLPFLFAHVVAIVNSRNLAAELRARRAAAPDRFMLAIKLSGGVGDYLVAARWMRDVIARAEPLTFDVYCNNVDLARWIFADVAGFSAVHSEFVFDRACEHYDCGVWPSQFVITRRPKVPPFRLVAHPRIEAMLDHIDGFRPRIATFVDRHPFDDGDLGRFACANGETRATFLHAISGIRYGGDRLAVRTDDGLLRTLGLASRPFITVHNGFDPSFVITAQTATKCYPHFAAVAALIKAARPDIVLVQVGSATSMPIAGVDLDLTNQTTLPQVAALIRGSVLHLGNESGLVHMARCFGVRCCVVFGPTPADYFGYPDNVNLPPPACGGCWWVNETWMDHCPQGHRVLPCMTQRPEDVAAAALAVLDNDCHARHAVSRCGRARAAAV
jgi:hypothetical protein